MFYFFIDLIKTLLNNIVGLINPSWPQLVLVIVILFIVIFRGDISKLIGRIEKISKDGAVFAPSQKAASETVEHLYDTIKKDEKKFNVIKNIIKDIKEKVNKNTSESEKIDELTIELAYAYFFSRCEKVYYNIFGSQINLLKMLNDNNRSGMSELSLAGYFVSVSSSYDEHKKHTIDQYMRFLFLSGLIIQDNGMVKISDFGIDFLTWLYGSGYSDQKPL